jgi:hypothetical protein
VFLVSYDISHRGGFICLVGREVPERCNHISLVYWKKYQKHNMCIEEKNDCSINIFPGDAIAKR